MSWKQRREVLGLGLCVASKKVTNAYHDFFSVFLVYFMNHSSTCLSDAKHTCALLNPLQDRGEPQISISFAQQKLTGVFTKFQRAIKVFRKSLWSYQTLTVFFTLCSTTRKTFETLMMLRNNPH